MILEEVPHYRIPRNEDDERESIYDHVFERALRWEPLRAYDIDGDGLDDTLVEVGRRSLRRLRDGDTVSINHLGAGIQFLEEAIAYYRRAWWEVYPGRNVEAVGNLSSLLHELRTAMVPT